MPLKRKEGQSMRASRRMATVACLPVHASGIGVPNVDVDVWDWLASLNVVVLNLQVEWDTLTVDVLDDVGADHFTPDVVWSIGDRRSEDGACDSVKDISLRSVGIVVEDASPVVVNGLPFGEIGGIASFEFGCTADSLGC